MEKITAAVIGLGQSGLMLDADTNREELWTHCFSLSKHEDIKLIGVVDADPTKKSSIQKLLPQNTNISFFNTTKEMLRNISPEFISICTPTTTHLEIIREVLETEKLRFIFCEKPMGASIKEAKEIMRLCREKEIILASNYMRRWDVKYSWIKEQINNKDLGKLIAINANGTTALYTSASHLIDMMLYFGGAVEEVSARLQDSFIRNVHGEKDPGANAFFRFNDSVTGHLKASSKDPFHYMFEIDLLFEEGRITIKTDGEEIIKSTFNHQYSTSGSGFLTLKEEEIRIQKNERMLESLTDIIECETNASEPKSNGENALLVHKIIDSIYKSSEEEGAFKKIE